MVTAPVKVCLLLVVTIALNDSAVGQPAESKKDVPTAFPNLKPPKDKKNWPELLFKKFPLPVPADASPLRKVQLHQANEGAAYLKKIVGFIATEGWNPSRNNEFPTIAFDLYRVLADAEPAPTARITWYADRVIVLKAFEDFVRVQVEAGNEPSQNLHLARYSRLSAECELLKLNDEVEKTGTPVVIAGSSIPTVRPPQLDMKTYLFSDIPSAFPNLKPPGKDLEYGDATAPTIFRVADIKQLSERVSKTFPLAVPAVASPLHKVQLGQANAGATYLLDAFKAILAGDWNPANSNEFAVAISDLYGLLAELEVTPASRVGWYEERVIMLKAFEALTRIRELASSSPPLLNHIARFHRLGAEAELLKLEESLVPAAPPIIVCPPPAPQCRPRPLLRRWR